MFYGKIYHWSRSFLPIVYFQEFRSISEMKMLKLEIFSEKGDRKGKS